MPPRSMESPTCTFSSVKSDATILLWGDRWWLPRHRIAVPFPEFDQAAAVLAAAWPGKKLPLRLIYQPADLASVAVNCPVADKSILGAALAAEHPALTHPGHVWGYEPIAAEENLGRTVLHYETRPGLFSLVRRLEDHGFAVESVWPLATWLAALAPAAMGEGTVLVAALAAGRGTLYRQGPEGRSVIHALDPAELGACTDVRGETKDGARTLLLTLSADDAALDAFAARLDPDVTLAGGFPLWDALAKPVALPPKHPAQLLPPLPKLSLMRVIIAANLLCLLVACVAGWQLYQRNIASKVAADAGAREANELRREIGALHEQAVETSQVEKAWRDARARPAARQLLETLAEDLPPGMVFRSCRIEGSGFEVIGWSDPALPPEVWRAWTERQREKLGAEPSIAAAPDAGGAWCFGGRWP